MFIYVTYTFISLNVYDLRNLSLLTCEYINNELSFFLGKMMFELEEIVNKLEDLKTECKGVIIYGANENFCSGGDLNMVKKMNKPEMGFAMATYMNHILEKFKKLPLITVAYIEGSGW